MADKIMAKKGEILGIFSKIKGNYLKYKICQGKVPAELGRYATCMDDLKKRNKPHTEKLIWRCSET